MREHRSAYCRTLPYVSTLVVEHLFYHNLRPFYFLLVPHLSLLRRFMGHFHYTPQGLNTVVGSIHDQHNLSDCIRVPLSAIEYLYDVPCRPSTSDALPKLYFSSGDSESALALLPNFVPPDFAVMLSSFPLLALLFASLSLSSRAQAPGSFVQSGTTLVSGLMVGCPPFFLSPSSPLTSLIQRYSLLTIRRL
jgi:hypothetical protein